MKPKSNQSSQIIDQIMKYLSLLCPGHNAKLYLVIMFYRVLSNAYRPKNEIYFLNAMVY